MKRVLFKKGPYRVVEVMDEVYRLRDLKGDCFDPKVNSDLDADELRRQELAFEKKIDNEGVFGYVLECWDPRVGAGWETLDSCWGFVGAYSETNKHYIVDELKAQIKETEGDK